MAVNRRAPIPTCQQAKQHIRQWDHMDRMKVAVRGVRGGEGRGLHLQVADFVGGDDDAGETAGVLDDGDAVDLLQAFVDDASATDVGESL